MVSATKLCGNWRVISRAVFYDQKTIYDYFSENMTLYDKTKMTEREHMSTVQTSITSNWYFKKWQIYFIKILWKSGKFFGKQIFAKFGTIWQTWLNFWQISGVEEQK